MVGAVGEENQSAFRTFPLRRQRVQTRIRLVDPSTTARTRWRLGLKVRFVLLLA